MLNTNKKIRWSDRGQHIGAVLFIFCKKVKKKLKFLFYHSDIYIENVVKFYLGGD